MATYAIGDVQACLEPLRASARRDRILALARPPLVRRRPGEPRAGLGGGRAIRTRSRGARRRRAGQPRSAPPRARRRPREATRRRHLRRPARRAGPRRAARLAAVPPDAARRRRVRAGARGPAAAWSVAKARDLAAEVEAELRAKRYRLFLAELYGSKPDAWDDGLRGMDRLRVIVNAMTRMRFCTADGVMDFRGERRGRRRRRPGSCRGSTSRRARPAARTIVCGHWSALGLRLRPDLLALDTGCVWGGALTAIRLEDRRLFQAPCLAPADTQAADRAPAR